MRKTVVNNTVHDANIRKSIRLLKRHLLTTPSFEREIGIAIQQLKLLQNSQKNLNSIIRTFSALELIIGDVTTQAIKCILSNVQNILKLLQKFEESNFEYFNDEDMHIHHESIFTILSHNESIVERYVEMVSTIKKALSQHKNYVDFGEIKSATKPLSNLLESQSSII